MTGKQIGTDVSQFLTVKYFLCKRTNYFNHIHAEEQKSQQDSIIRNIAVKLNNEHVEMVLTTLHVNEVMQILSMETTGYIV